MQLKSERTKTAAAEPKKGYNFVQLLKEVETTAKEPKKARKDDPPPLPIQSAKDFTKEDIDVDQFGELLAELKPKKEKKDPKATTRVLRNGRKEPVKPDKPAKTPVSAKDGNRPSMKKPEKLPQKVVMAPKTVDDLIHERRYSESSDDDRFGFRPFHSEVGAIPGHPYGETEEHHSEEKAAPKADFNAFEARIKEYEAKKQAKLERLKEQTAPTFKPTVNKKSEILDQKKRGFTGKTNRHDHLYDQNVVQKLQDLNLRRTAEKEDEEDLAECTFKPQINRYDRSPYDRQASIAERHRQWDQVRQEKIKELQEYKQVKETSECTFHPETNKQEIPAVSRLYYNT